MKSKIFSEFLCILLSLILTSFINAEKIESTSTDQSEGSQLLRVYLTKKSNPQSYEQIVSLAVLGKIDILSSTFGFIDIIVKAAQVLDVIRQLDNYGIKFTVELVQMEEEVRRHLNEVRSLKLKSKDNEMTWNNYHNYDTISNWMNKISRDSRIAQVNVYGKSFEGRDLKYVKISTPGGLKKKTGIFIDGGFHSREWISPAFVTYLINEFTTKSRNYKDILDRVEFYFVPVVNPDGYEYSHKNDKTRMWRKTRSNHTDSKCVGTDPNRNFAYGYGGEGVSFDKCSEIYLGPSAFSEPETYHLKELILKINREQGQLGAYLTIHSYSQLWLVPWGFTSDYPEDFNELEQLGLDAVKALESVHGTKYEVGHSANLLYPAAGASDDWAKGAAGIRYSYTVELRDQGRHGFLLPPHLILPTCQETLEAIKVVAQKF